MKQVDAAIMEVGLGGKFDATNVVSSKYRVSRSVLVFLNVILKSRHYFQVQEPIVCGVSSLGYDHMEILG